MTEQEAINVFKGFKFTPREMKAVEMGIEALEKQIPKMVVDKDNCCTICEEMIPRWEYQYCPNCGQKIDWSEYDRAD